jgi:hypothetical protein
MKFALLGLALGTLLIMPVGFAPVQAQQTCHLTEGEWIANTDHYAATLLGEMTERITLYKTPGGEEATAYGLGQDPVVEIARACIQGKQWSLIRFPSERYSTTTDAWIPSSMLRLH